MSGILPYISIFGLIGTIATAIAVVVKLGPEKTSIEIANADKIIVRQRDWSEELAKKLDKALHDLATLDERVHECERRSEEQEAINERLRKQLRALGAEPA